jgi:hypothetical protein
VTGDALQPNLVVSQYEVSLLPPDHLDHHLFCVEVHRAPQMSGVEWWAVRRMGRCLSRRGVWEHEPLPSSRTDAWLKRFRFPNLEEALAAARKALPEITVNGQSAADAMARRS